MPEYAAWRRLKERCYNKGGQTWKHYGGRGITVCDRWRDSFENFLADMGPRPSGRHSLDRIDNNGNYEPGNCRWATQRVQANNRRGNKRIEFRGETLTVAQWAAKLGIVVGTLKNRILCWGVEKAFTAPISTKHRNRLARRRVEAERSFAPFPWVPA